VTRLAEAPRATATERDVARAYLMRELASFGWTPMLDAYPSGANVYATIPSTTGSDKQIVVGAHFDTVVGSPGANDNATGCAVVLAVARRFVDISERDPNLIVVLFDEEEVGLFGSRAFAASLTAADVVAVHSIDQVGWDSDGDRKFELELPTPALERDYRAAAAQLAVPLTVTSTSGTDHASFRDLAMPAVGLTEGYVEGDTTPYRHTPGDVPSTVDFDYTATAARLVNRVVEAEIRDGLKLRPFVGATAGNP
jgi:Zn-dependent M28 family amino/carboxypeptidase